MNQECRECCKVGRQIDHLCHSGGSLNIQSRQSGQYDQKKGSGSRTVKSIVHSNDKGCTDCHCKCSRIGKRSLLRTCPEIFIFQNIEGDNRKNRNHQILQDLITCQKRKSRSNHRSNECRNTGANRKYNQLSSFNIPVFQISGC